MADASKTTTADCLGCRLTGTATLLGLSTYFMVERSKLPRRDLGQRRWLLVCSAAFAVAGAWRATTGVFAQPVPDQPEEAKPSQ